MNKMLIVSVVVLVISIAVFMFNLYVLRRVMRISRDTEELGKRLPHESKQR